MESNEAKTSTLTPFEFYNIECLEGWHSLIQPILDYVKEYNEDKEVDDRIAILQIKEKWGSLRIYTNFVTDKLEKLIEDAEIESLKVCEKCGTHDHVGTKHDGWRMTLCKNCVQELANKEKRSHIWCENGGDRSYVIEPTSLP